MYGDSSNLQFQNCIFRDNQAFDRGGSITSTESQLGISSCFFGDNVAENEAGRLVFMHTDTQLWDILVEEQSQCLIPMQ